MASITFPATLRIERRVIGTTVIMAAATALGALFRFYELGKWSFWIDEMITLRQAESLTALDVVREPAFRAFIGSALDLFGSSEWSARLVPALVGVITIPALYLIARRLFDKEIALTASLLLAISPWHIYWSQNARFYTIILLLYTAALFAFYVGIEEDRPGYLIAAGALLFLAARERDFAMFLIPVAGAYLAGILLFRFERPSGLNRRNIALMGAIGIGVTLLIAGPYMGNPTQWSDTFNLINTNPLWILSGVMFYIGVPVVILSVFGGAYLLHSRNRPALLLILSAIIPLVAVMGLSLVQYAANRYMFMTLPSYLILASVAVWELFRRSDQVGRVMATGVLTLLIVTSLSEDVLYYRYQNGNRDDWRSALEVVKSGMGPSDRVISSAPNVASYYLGAPVTSMANLDLEALKRSEVPIWFVEDMNAAGKFPAVHQWMTKNAELVANLDVHVRARNFLMRVQYYDPADG